MNSPFSGLRYVDIRAINIFSRFNRMIAAGQRWFSEKILLCAKVEIKIISYQKCFKVVYFYMDFCSRTFYQFSFHRFP